MDFCEGYFSITYEDGSPTKIYEHAKGTPIYVTFSLLVIKQTEALRYMLIGFCITSLTSGMTNNVTEWAYCAMFTPSITKSV